LAISLSKAAAMRAVLTIKESSHGLWCICSGSAILYDKPPFAQAIRLSRALAREEHDSSGHAVGVEMVCSEFSISLVQYTGLDVTGQAAAA
jgi:hypothetical protein